MSEMKTYYYFEACGYVSEPFQAANDAAAIDHAEKKFRDPTDPDFDNDDGGIMANDDSDGEDWWHCLTTFIGDTAWNQENSDRLSGAIDSLEGSDAPTPSATR